MIIDSFTQQSDVQASDGSNSLTGKIDPQSQQLIGTLFFIFKKSEYSLSYQFLGYMGELIVCFFLEKSDENIRRLWKLIVRHFFRPSM